MMGGGGKILFLLKLDCIPRIILVKTVNTVMVVWIDVK